MSRNAAPGGLVLDREFPPPVGAGRDGLQRRRANGRASIAPPAIGGAHSRAELPAIRSIDCNS
ncbi:hypothetical protein [Derxia lacustris]|uniref:hypothetical protein n=1 Tax=Derxia lacustris TaxID=764842 RepID=UPI00111C7341|nr:hypothetical protein [Derxia lacustris]